MFQRLWKSKTFWTAVATIVGAVGAWAQDVIDPATMVQTIVGAIIAVFIRDGIAKGK